MAENTIVIFLSDHAEAFGEHGEFFHTNCFWIEGIRVPLMISIPEKLKKNFSREQLENLTENTKNYVANLDIFPTLVEMLHITTSKQFDGQSLLQPPGCTFIFSTQGLSDDEFTKIDRKSGMKFTFDNTKHRRYISNLKENENEEKYEEYPLDSPYATERVFQNLLIENMRS